MIKRIYEALISLPKAVYENPMIEDIDEDSQHIENPDDDVHDDEYRNSRID